MVKKIEYKIVKYRVRNTMLTKDEKLALIKEFGANETDTGSTAVQIAFLTKKIERLQKHLQENKKDYSSQRGLMQMVHDRKGLLKYLQRTTDTNNYKSVIDRLGIRK